MRARRDQRGAASVEAAILMSTILMPLLVGALYWGNWFWQAQRVDPLAASVPVDGIVGSFTCDELVNQVRTTVTDNLNNNPVTFQVAGRSLTVTDVAASVVKALPTVGAYVQVSVTLPGVDALGGLIPLPGGGSLVSEATYRLNNVVVTSGSCR